MIPLRDQASSKGIPLITVLLIIINIYVFLKEIQLGSTLRGVINHYAVIPAYYLSGDSWHGAQVLQKQVSLVSALFLHAGWIHVLSNMWYLWIFGDNIESTFGHTRFLLFYITCGVSGNAAHIIMNNGSTVPALGASGCIAGVLGAYFLLFPRAKIVTLLPIIIFWTIAEVPAFFFLGIWFLIQFFNGFAMLPCSEQGSCIAWWAHIGGFTAGVVLTLFFKVTGRIRR